MRCHNCKDSPAAYVTFHHNIGMLFMRKSVRSHERMCGQCTRHAFWYHQSRNLVLGWWGIASFFLTWLFLVGNTVRYVSANHRLRREGEKRRPGAAAPEAERRLEAFDENVARRLRGGECPDDIAADLVEATGVDAQLARGFVAQRRVQIE